MNTRNVYRKRKKRLRPSVIFSIAVIITLLLFGICYLVAKPEPVIPNVDRDEVIQNTPNPENPAKEETPSGVDPDPEITPEPEQTPQPETSETRLSFVAAGDNLIHSAVYEDAKRVAKEQNMAEEYYFDGMYENFKDTFSSADIAFINQETMLAGDKFAISGYPHFNTPEEMGETLQRLGFDVINLATNHCYDMGRDGLLNCINYFKDTPITTVGAYESQTDRENIRVIEKDGVKIAFLCYVYGTNSYPANNTLIVPFIDNETMATEVKKAKEVADLVFVSMHWGTEDVFNPTSSQRDAAQALVDAGADVIIGTHPHVIGEIKWKDRPDGKKTLIAYSLGNFISTMHYPWNMLGGLLSFDIVKDENGARVENPLFIPTMTHYSKNRDSLALYRLEEYSQELYDTHGTTLKNSQWSYDRLVNQVKDTVSKEFLEDWIINY